MPFDDYDWKTRDSLQGLVLASDIQDKNGDSVWLNLEPFGGHTMDTWYIWKEEKIIQVLEDLFMYPFYCGSYLSIWGVSGGEDRRVDFTNKGKAFNYYEARLGSTWEWRRDKFTHIWQLISMCLGGDKRRITSPGSLVVGA